jgi:hypothetical protein
VKAGQALSAHGPLEFLRTNDSRLVRERRVVRGLSEGARGPNAQSPLARTAAICGASGLLVIVFTYVHGTNLGLPLGVLISAVAAAAIHLSAIRAASSLAAFAVMIWPIYLLGGFITTWGTSAILGTYTGNLKELSSAAPHALWALALFLVSAAISMTRWTSRSLNSGILCKVLAQTDAWGTRFRLNMPLARAMPILLLSLTVFILLPPTRTSVGAQDPRDLLIPAFTAAPAILFANRLRLAGAVVLAIVCSYSVLDVAVQGLISPIVLCFLASSRLRLAAGRAVRLVLIVSVGAIVAAALAWGPGRSTSGIGSFENVEGFQGLLADIANQDVITDSYLAATADPGSISLSGLATRIPFAPVPRALWADKPLSYDFAFREEFFPALVGALPITIVGTTYASVGFVGVIVAGVLVGRLARRATRSIDSNSFHERMAAGIVIVFILDLVRIGGAYRELLTISITIVGAVLLVAFIGTNHPPAARR